MLDIKSLKGDSVQSHGLVFVNKYYLFKFTNKEIRHLSLSPSNKFNFLGIVYSASEKRSKA